ncbi:protein tyrosine phosphatase [Onishia taeanensis]|uniref:protein-tyrosine-phosphatase n=1 Tax=Onishia taeanensis TaxID=284577 RepID=A0A1G7QLG5_9GAMM|nr:low molecular weight protein-tyrosine-phosphatase [Halomonas taeanensis]SDF99387.1 protein tyrosine phosphatase [Halomonas taeanensis]
MIEQVLVVCRGNICRSPVAAAMLKQLCPGKRVESAGLGALVGQGVDPVARRLAEAEGLDVTGHMARQLTQGMLQQTDLVLVMSHGQRLAVGELSPAALGKTMLFGHWLESKAAEIPDPYRKSEEAFQHVHQQLWYAANAWAEKL